MPTRKSGNHFGQEVGSSSFILCRSPHELMVVEERVNSSTSVKPIPLVAPTRKDLDVWDDATMTPRELGALAERGYPSARAYAACETSRQHLDAIPPSCRVNEAERLACLVAVHWMSKEWTLCRSAAQG